MFFYIQVKEIEATSNFIKTSHHFKPIVIGAESNEMCVMGLQSISEVIESTYGAQNNENHL